jgi:hypothetical protein
MTHSIYVSRSQLLLQYLLAVDKIAGDNGTFEDPRTDVAEVRGAAGDPECST